MGSQTNERDQSEEIYNRVNSALEAFLTDHVVAPLRNPSLVGIHMIKKFSKSWGNHKIMTKWVQQLFCHLDRGYVFNSQGAAATLVACSMCKFLDIGFGHTFERVRDGVLDLIEEERNGREIDREEVRSCIEVFVVMGLCQSRLCKNVKSVQEMLKMKQDLSIYEGHFETQFIESTATYYRTQSALWKQESVPEYLIKCERALTEEQERVSHYLERTTEAKLLGCVEVELLSGPQVEIVQRPNSGMYSLLMEAMIEKPLTEMPLGEREESKSAHLARMYQLFKRKGVVLQEQPMAEVFEQFVRDEGSKLVAARKDAIKQEVAAKKKEDTKSTAMIVAMLKLYVRCEALVKDLFRNNMNFQRAMKEAFQVFVNQDASDAYTNVEMLVTYADMVLKGKEGADKLDDNEILRRLEGIMRVFSFLADKDIFIERYREQLAKRLLNGKMSNNDMEKDMITKLKAAQGTQFTAKVEGMLKDFEMRADNTAEFLEQLAEKQKTGSVWAGDQQLPAKALGCEATVHVITTHFWPSQTAVNTLPRGVFSTVMQQYEAFFNEKHSQGKRLTWKFVLGDAEVEAKFPKKKFTIKCATLQAMALSLINDAAGAMSTEGFINEMGCSVDVIKRVLHSLSCQKHKVLKKTPVSSKVSETDMFEPDPGFNAKLKKFEIPMANLDKVQTGKEIVKEDRSNAIDAALVRIMKARKRLAHSVLISEVLNQLRNFSPDNRAVKKRIESLIEREYLERHIDDDGQNTNMYNYLA
jgi:cullin 1